MEGLVLLWSLLYTLHFDDESDAERVWSCIQETYIQSEPQHVDWGRPQTTEELVTEWVETFATNEGLKTGRLFETPKGYFWYGASRRNRR